MADGAGRQLWDFKDGDARGDRPAHAEGVRYRELSWNATFGMFGIVQVGPAWEKWRSSPIARSPPRLSRPTVMRSGRVAPLAEPTRSTTQLHAELQGEQARHFQLSADVFNG